MKIKKILFMFIFILFFVPVIVKAETPEITASSGIVIDCIDGRILYEKNSSEKIYPASITLWESFFIRLYLSPCPALLSEFFSREITFLS